MEENTLVVLPTFNERENVGRVVDALMRHLRCSVLVVDDESPDGTGDLAEELAVAHPGRIQVMHRRGPRGLGRAYVDGLRRALATSAPVIVQMDCDLSHDPAALPAIVEQLRDADLAIGSRYVPGGRIVNWPVRRQMLSAFANRYVRSITRLRVRDCTSGYRAWRRQALAATMAHGFGSDGYSFLVEMLYAAVAVGCRVAESPITFVERRFGESKLSSKVLLESAITPWRLAFARQTRPAAPVAAQAFQPVPVERSTTAAVVD